MAQFNQTRIVLLVSIVLTAMLYLIPQLSLLAYPFMLLSTLAHEMGHGIAALFVGGAFHKFQMWGDGSGVATISTSGGRFASAVTSAGGLIGPAVAAALGFAFGRTEVGARRCLLALSTILLIALVLVVRNLFGAFFVFFVLAICVLVAIKASPDVAQLLLVFLSVQLALSVFSRGDYLFTPTAQTAMGAMPSDVGQMANALFLPFWFWGFVCGLISVVVLLYGLKAFWK